MGPTFEVHVGDARPGPASIHAPSNDGDLLVELHAPVDIEVAAENDYLLASFSQSLQTSEQDVDLRFTLDACAPDFSPTERASDKRSLRHRLFFQQQTLKLGLVYKVPSLPPDAAMESIMPIIHAAFKRRPSEIVQVGEPFDAAATVGSFWHPQDFAGVPPQLQDILRQTYEAEQAQTQYMLANARPYGHRISALGAAALGAPPHVVKAWDTGATFELTEEPLPYYRKPYSSVYASLEVLTQTCRETLRLVSLGKAIPWKRRPLKVSPTAMILKASPFEADGIKKRQVYDFTASGLNSILHVPESKLPTIFSLLESMGPNYYMAKADLKDMFYNFPVHQQHWTLLGFSHPITAQYFVIPFFPFGLSQAPPDCQMYAESVCAIISEESQRRIAGQESLPGLDSVERRADGLAVATDASEASSHVYIDDFQHLTKLLQQGHEIFEIGGRVFELLGLVEKIVKREGPARIMTLLGFEFNSVTQFLSIPQVKCDELVHLIDQMLDMGRRRGAVPFSVLLSLVGKLTWASTGIMAGRAYLSGLRRPLDAVASLLTHRTQRTSFLIPVAEFSDMLSELRWWRSALQINAGSVLVHVGSKGLFERWHFHGQFGDAVPSDVVEVFTDACPAGGGWAWGTERGAFLWSKHDRQHHINILEAFTIHKFLKSEGRALTGCKVLVWCDNTVTVRAIRKGRSKSRVLTQIVKYIRLLCLRFSVDVWPAHIAGVANVLADGLSRGLVSARSDAWSFNRFIMARWRSQYGEFHVDAFADPSGRGAQAPAYCSVVDSPFHRRFAGQRVWAFPPISLVSEFLEALVGWEAALVLAVLPISWEDRTDRQCSVPYSRLHVYPSAFGIFVKPSNDTFTPCAPMGYKMGVYLFHTDIRHVPL